MDSSFPAQRRLFITEEDSSSQKKISVRLPNVDGRKPQKLSRAESGVVDPTPVPQVLSETRFLHSPHSPLPSQPLKPQVNICSRLKQTFELNASASRHIKGRSDRQNSKSRSRSSSVNQCTKTRSTKQKSKLYAGASSSKLRSRLTESPASTGRRHLARFGMDRSQNNVGHSLNLYNGITQPSLQASNSGPNALRSRQLGGTLSGPGATSTMNLDGPTSSKRPRHSAFQRPSSLRGMGIYQESHRAPITNYADSWMRWNELSVKVFGLPTEITTRDVWSCFSKEGTISTIELFDDKQGKKDGKARVRFSPPPRKPFWQVDIYPVKVTDTAGIVNLRLDVEPPKRTFIARSPVNPSVTFPESMALYAECIDFGFMYGPRTMMGMYRAVPTQAMPLGYRVDLLHREIEVQFQLNIRDPRTISAGSSANQSSHKNVPRSAKVGKYNRTDTFRFRLPFAQLSFVQEIDSHPKDRKDHLNVILIQMEAPPNYYRKFDEVDTHDESSTFWNSKDAWYRQTDIMYNPKKLKSSPVTLKKIKPIIDIGRWTSYRFVFDMKKNKLKDYDQIRHALRDHNVETAPLPEFNLITNRAPAVWEYIDKHISRESKLGSSLDELTIDSIPMLSFPTRYQLEVCISQNILNEHNITREFITRLMEMQESEAQELLEYVANQGRRIYDPMEIFGIKIVKRSKSKIPSFCYSARSATVTPSTVYFNTPTIEMSNRVVRQYSEYADRFLRVRFTDEKSEGRIHSNEKATNDELYTRIYRVMCNGLSIGDRHFEFLAFGNSQFREHGAYFFSPLEHLSTEGIRRWMGVFRDIKIVAKHAARLGQCFSTTRAVPSGKLKIIEIEDVERNGYCFTDGVGKISEFLAKLAADAIGLPFGELPSLFQFRLGGCKGVLVVTPEAREKEIFIRKSQYKFAAIHEGLEIIRCSKFITANLNRQLILVLSTLGTPDKVFTSKLEKQLSDLRLAMTDHETALRILQKDVDPNQMTLTVASMVLDGFQTTGEPFMASLLQLWRAWSIKYLKEKARITITEGAYLFGCIDETATLKGHYDNMSAYDPDATLEENLQNVPEVFVQLSRGSNDRPVVIEGPIVLARNPSLHPGDIRVVRGVNIPALAHLKDVVVLPQTGDRDLASMCSGGDLDGDDYIVIWDKDLLPPRWNHEPMDYTSPKPVQVEREVRISDITSFFVTYMKNDTLGAIATAHLAYADQLDAGLKDERCLRLANLHSMAVDYNKTGVPAKMSASLRPRLYPHFMESKYRSKDKIYISKKILGQLYDQVERVDFAPVFNTSFDGRILSAYELDANILHDAASLKEEYDAAMRRIMAQHEIATEFEVWSTFVLQHAQHTKDFKFHEEIGNISGALKERFRSACYDKAGSKEFDVMSRFVAAMYQVTHNEVSTAISKCNEVRIIGGKEVKKRCIDPKTMPLMSFPWLFHGILGRIANCDVETNGVVDTAMPIQGGQRRTTPRKKDFGRDLLDDDNTLQTTEGLTNRGEILELFQNDEEKEQGDGLTSSNSELQNVGGQMSPSTVCDNEIRKPSAAGVDIIVNDPSSSRFDTFTARMQDQDLIDLDFCEPTGTIVPDSIPMNGKSAQSSSENLVEDVLGGDNAYTENITAEIGAVATAPLRVDPDTHLIVDESKDAALTREQKRQNLLREHQEMFSKPQRQAGTASSRFLGTQSGSRWRKSRKRDSLYTSTSSESLTSATSQGGSLNNSHEMEKKAMEDHTAKATEGGLDELSETAKTLSDGQDLVGGEEDGASEIEEVVIPQDNKPTLLQRLAQLTAD